MLLGPYICSALGYSWSRQSQALILQGVFFHSEMCREWPYPQPALRAQASTSLRVLVSVCTRQSVFWGLNWLSWFHCLMFPLAHHPYWDQLPHLSLDSSFLFQGLTLWQTKHKFISHIWFFPHECVNFSHTLFLSKINIFINILTSLPCMLPSYMALRPLPGLLHPTGNPAECKHHVVLTLHVLVTRQHPAHSRF